MRKMVEWSQGAILMLPSSMLLDWIGLFSSTGIPGGSTMFLVGAAVASVVGWHWHPRAKAALARFEAEISLSPELNAIYKVDVKAGQISELRAELLAATTLAAAQAKRGNAVAAGLALGYAKTVESRLRERGC
ncbi:MAG: hypothetical protein WCJ64_01450 [Rhodospirillaceae bacterium]